VAPTSPDTVAAKQALDKRTIADKLGAAEKVAAEKGAQSDQTALTGVKGGVAATHVTSLAHVKGSASAPGKKVGKGKKVADANDDQAKPAAGKSYKVAKGDTLFSIAKSHAVDVAQLRSWNHLKGDNVKPGQSLRISHD
jgi:phosphate transport system substrate-binding protein